MRFAFAAVALAAFPGLPFAQESRPAGPTVEIRVPLRDGKVSLLALARAVCDASDLDGSKVRFDDVELPVGGVPGALALSALEIAADGALSLHRTSDSLRVEIDRARAREVRRGIKRGLARLVGGREPETPACSLEIPAPQDPREPVVVLVHGLGGDGESWRHFRTAVAKDAAGLAVCELHYSNELGIDEAGAELARRLAEYRREHPKRPVYLVAHSMGGLVARYAIETPGLDPGNVRLLVMLGTPNGGSRLSRLHIAGDLARLALHPKDPDRFESALRALIGDADGDLKPGSVILDQLNARPRNPAVEYRLALGTRAPLGPKDLESLRDLCRDAASKLGSAAWLAPKLERLADDLDELEDGKGDGAVALRRGELPGVEAVRLDLGHYGLADSPAAHALVFEWLESRRKRDRRIER